MIIQHCTHATVTVSGSLSLRQHRGTRFLLFRSSLPPIPLPTWSTDRDQTTACMLRGRGNSSTSTMGLLDGLADLQGAPPPSCPDPTASFGARPNSFVQNLQSSLSAGVEGLGAKTATASSNFRRLLGDESAAYDLEAAAGPPAQQTVSEELNALFDLSLFQRVTLFAITFAAGVVLLAVSVSFLPLILVVPHKFVASFTMGNVLAIGSSWILVGPRAQIRAMFHPVRAVAAGAYLASLVFAVFAAFFGGRFRYILVLVALVVEVAALLWFSLSFIPYSRQIIASIVGGLSNLRSSS